VSGVVADAERVVGTGHRVDGGGHIVRPPRTEPEPLMIVFARPSVRVECSRASTRRLGARQLAIPGGRTRRPRPKEHRAWRSTRARELASRAIASASTLSPAQHLRPAPPLRPTAKTEQKPAASGARPTRRLQDSWKQVCRSGRSTGRDAQYAHPHPANLRCLTAWSACAAFAFVPAFAAAPLARLLMSVCGSRPRGCRRENLGCLARGAAVWLILPLGRRSGTRRRERRSRRGHFPGGLDRAQPVAHEPGVAIHPGRGLVGSRLACARGGRARARGKD
jgi:hypothetical protein